jgi:hypothetical protein
MPVRVESRGSIRQPLHRRWPWRIAIGLICASALTGSVRSSACAQTAVSGAPSGRPDAAPPVPAVNGLLQLADQFDKSAGTIVADVSGTPITLGMVADRLRDLPPQLAVLPPTVVYKAALDDLIQQRALAIKARELGVDKDAVAQRHIGEATDHELARAMAQRILPELVTEKAIRGRYDAMFAGKPGPDEVRFRVIATATESAANDVLTALHNGAGSIQLQRWRDRLHETRPPDARNRGGRVRAVAWPDDGLSRPESWTLVYHPGRGPPADGSAPAGRGARADRGGTDTTGRCRDFTQSERSRYGEGLRHHRHNRARHACGCKISLDYNSYQTLSALRLKSSIIWTVQSKE